MLKILIEIDRENDNNLLFLLVFTGGSRGGGDRGGRGGFGGGRGRGGGGDRGGKFYNN